MKQEGQNKITILNNILLIFLIIQPFLDIYMAVVGEKLDIFGVSIATLIRTTFVVALFILIAIYQIKNKVRVKLLYLISTYLAAVLIYSIAHHLNIVYSSGYYITEGIYNFLTELMYVERLVIPVLLMYSVIITKPDKIKLEKILVTVVTIISLVIIVTNLLKVSFASYSAFPDENTTISYNFIDWFTNDNILYKESLSKGLFVSANQIGALLTVLLPIVISCLIRENKPYMYLVFLLQITAMTLIGTRVASLGWMLVSLFMILTYLVLLLLKRVNSLKQLAICTFVLILELGTLLYIKSPAKNREHVESFEGMYDEEINLKTETGEYIALEAFSQMLEDDKALTEYVGSVVSDKGLKYDAMCKYISETHRYHYITNKYVNDIYPYQDDPVFWLKIFSMPVSIKGDNRGRQIEIVKRIKNNNNNQLLDTLVGMGATPMNSRGYMIENDLISHYYNLGILGIILFMTPFVFVILYVLIIMRKNIMGLFDLRFITYSLTICMAYFVGYFAGHVLDEYIVSIFIATIAGIIYNLYSKGELDERTET